MADPRYIWRQLTPKQRAELLGWRKKQQHPWHSPPHTRVLQTCFHVSAACYEHRPWIGATPERMSHFSSALLACLSKVTTQIHSWCVLPNHYHVLVSTTDNLSLINAVGKFHGSTAYSWNQEESRRGRKVFFGAIDKPIRSDRHFWATMNYIHHNPVRHRYAATWHEWPWSSAAAYLKATGEDEARRIWQMYPILDMGQNWDAPDL